MLRWESTDPLGPPSPLLDSYPRALQLSNGDILIPFDLITDGSQPQPNDAAAWWVAKLYETGTNRFELWRGNSQTAVPALDRNYGGAVLMHQADGLHQPKLDRVILLGGASLTAASASVQEFEPLPPPTGNLGGTVVNGTLHSKQALSLARNFHNAIALPTGEILLTQGSPDPLVGTGNAIVQPELYDPDRDPALSGSTTLMSPPNQVGNPPKYTSRTYHHIAVLLPDGRVFIAGGEAPGSSSSYANGQYSGEIFSPPYLETGLQRPVIQDIDTTLNMSVAGSPPIHFTIVMDELNEGFTFDRVVLTRPAAVTHGFDSDQRYIELGFTSLGSDDGYEKLEVETLADNLGTPGTYMLWVIASDGTVRVPSMAVFLSFT